MVITKILDNVERYIDSLGLPDIQVSDSVREFDIEHLQLGNVANSTDDQLSEMLVFYGSWKAFLESELSILEAEKTILNDSFQEGLFNGFNKLHQEYTSRMEKMPIKDAMRGEILSSNPVLSKIKKDLIAVEAKAIQLKGARESYKTLYDTVSRVVALRLRGKFDE